jgi:heme exporter protein CcmD
MDFSAKHIGFVLGCYVLSFLVLALLTVATLLRDRRMRAEAGRLDARRRTPDQ